MNIITEGKPAANASQWKEKVKVYHLPRAEVNKVIMEYLVKEGFKDVRKPLTEKNTLSQAAVISYYLQAVMAFQAESGVDPGVNMSILDEQIKIRDAVEVGNIQEAIELVNDVDPEILDTDSRLFFHLQQQQLLELVREGDIERVLAFAQSELSARGEENPEFLDELEQTLALLAFEDPGSCPFSDLLQHSQRLKVVSELNAAILASQDQEATSKLSTLMKLVLWAQDQLEKKLLSFPKLSNIAAGKLE